MSFVRSGFVNSDFGSVCYAGITGFVTSAVARPVFVNSAYNINFNPVSLVAGDYSKWAIGFVVGWEE